MTGVPNTRSFLDKRVNCRVIKDLCSCLIVVDRQDTICQLVAEIPQVPIAAKNQEISGDSAGFEAGLVSLMAVTQLCS